jgi:SNF2 family DNA or RNA helicase
MVRSLADLSTWQLILSGTPTDKFEDYYAQFEIIQPGVLGDDFEDFRERYLKMGGFRDKQIVGYKNVQRLRQIVQHYSSRTTLREAQIEAGRKPYIVKRSLIKFELDSRSRNLYDELEEKLEAVIESGRQRKKIKIPLVVSLVQKLQQIAGGFLIQKEQLYNEDGTPKLTANGKPVYREEILKIGREKLRRLQELLVMNSIFRTEKFVVCANYTHELNAIAHTLATLGFTYKHVDGKNTFDGKFDTDCILLQVRSGEAIDLADARTYVFYSWNWSFINYEQAMFRILKFTSRFVRYFYLIANNTVDQEIYDGVMAKQKISRFIIDNRTSKRAT